LQQLRTLDVQVVIRVPLIPGITDTLENMASIAKSVRDIAGLIRVDLLPYNLLAGAKYPLLGLEYQPGFDEDRQPQVITRPFADLGIRWRLV
jgi:pyruvate formate lyase activating enzyme